MWARLLTILGVMAVAGCRLGTDTNSVTIRLSSAETAVVQGGSSAMTITVTNASPRTISATFSDCPPYTLEQVDGPAAGPSGWICLGVVPAPVHVAAGESYSRELRWNTSSLAQQGITASEPYLPRGRYLLSAQVIIDGQQYRATRTVEVLAANE
jgi:hypothetical protein